MIKSTIVLIAVILVIGFVQADQKASFVPTTSELDSARARLRPTSCTSVGGSTSRCLNSRSNECCSRECDENTNKCKCSSLGERCASNNDCCARSVGASTFQIPCLNRICTLAEKNQ